VGAGEKRAWYASWHMRELYRRIDCKILHKILLIMYPYSQHVVIKIIQIIFKREGETEREIASLNTSLS